VDRRKTFAVETTLSSRNYVSRLQVWSAAGYSTILHFLELPSADYAVGRVARRVAAGGHAVPEVDIRRRFERGLEMFAMAYKPLVDRWYHWRSDDRGLRLDDYSIKDPTRP
jgi:predicted ABC-type ATPase